MPVELPFYFQRQETASDDDHLLPFETSHVHREGEEHHTFKNRREVFGQADVYEQSLAKQLSRPWLQRLGPTRNQDVLGLIFDPFQIIGVEGPNELLAREIDRWRFVEVIVRHDETFAVVADRHTCPLALRILPNLNSFDRFLPFTIERRKPLDMAKSKPPETLLIAALK